MNKSKTKKESWEIFAELRKQFKEQNPEDRDDDWLDDEQFYCEKIADSLIGAVNLFVSPLRFFVIQLVLQEYLESTLGHSVEEYS